MWSIKLRYRKQWSSFEIIILGFAGVILAGALLLMLPVASREGNVTPFTETLFTATSAACVTGLAVRDTAVDSTISIDISLKYILVISDCLTIMYSILYSSLALLDMTTIRQLIS